MTNQEINEAVAKKLGWTFNEQIEEMWTEPWKDLVEDPKHPEDTTAVRSSCKEPRAYSTSIEAAWEVVKFIGKPKNGVGFCLELTDSGHEWTAALCEQGELPEENHIAQADSAPLAICKAFLKLEVS